MKSQRRRPQRMERELDNVDVSGSKRVIDSTVVMNNNFSWVGGEVQMRFIVDFYRYVILAGIALMIIGLVYLGLELATQDSPWAEYSWTVVAVGALIIGIYVMTLGMTATFISVHDRHAEIVAELRALREHLESRG